MCAVGMYELLIVLPNIYRSPSDIHIDLHLAWKIIRI